MKVAFQSESQSALNGLSDSLFQRRIAVEVPECVVSGEEDIRLVFTPSTEDPDAITFACCDASGEVLPGTPGFGEYMIPRHAYDVYPFNQNDEAVLNALGMVDAVVGRVTEVLVP